MANNSGQYDNTTTSPPTLNAKYLLTIEGYKELFENSDNASDVFSRQVSLYKMYSGKAWKDKLDSLNLFESAHVLFDIHTKWIPVDKSVQYNDYASLSQCYSLLENVFRNVLLRPYVPGYRTINKDCGRYRSFIQPYEHFIPFAELTFQSNGSNLLTYQETDSTKTILYAVTCSILYHYCLVKLNNFDRDQTHR